VNRDPSLDTVRGDPLFDFAFPLIDEILKDQPDAAVIPETSTAAAMSTPLAAAVTPEPPAADETQVTISQAADETPGTTQTQSADETTGRAADVTPAETQAADVTPGQATVETPATESQAAVETPGPANAHAERYAASSRGREEVSRGRC
jgi:hypothetical protein